MNDLLNVKVPFIINYYKKCYEDGLHFYYPKGATMIIATSKMKKDKDHKCIGKGCTKCR